MSNNGKFSYLDGVRFAINPIFDDEDDIISSNNKQKLRKSNRKDDNFILDQRFEKAVSLINCQVYD